MDEKESGIEELESMFTNASSETIRISYSVIKFITKNLRQEIGRGGFGTVYLVYAFIIDIMQIINICFNSYMLYVS